MRSCFLLMCLCLLGTGTALAQTAPVANGEPVNVPVLIENALGNGKGSKLLSEYTYTLRMMWRKPDKQGRIIEESETYEAYFPSLKNKGLTKFVMLKTKENDRPVAPDKLDKERQKAAARLLKAEEDAQKSNQRNAEVERDNGSKALGAYFKMSFSTLFSKLSLDVSTLLESCDFTRPRRERLDGREVIALDFRPKAGAEFSREEQYLAQSAGTIWIDAAEKVLLRVEGWPRNLATRAGNPAFVYEQMRLPEGYWLPRVGRMNGMSHPSLFGRGATDYVFEFSNYQRFGAEIKDVKIKPPREQN